MPTFLFLLFCLSSLFAQEQLTPLLLKQELAQTARQLEQLKIDIPAAEELWKEVRTLQLRADDSLINPRLLESQANARWQELLLFRTQQKHFTIEKSLVDSLLKFIELSEELSKDTDLLTLSSDSVIQLFNDHKVRVSKDIPLYQEQLKEINFSHNAILLPEDSLYHPKIRSWEAREKKAISDQKGSFLDLMNKSDRSIQKLDLLISEIDSLRNKQAWNSRWEARGKQLLNVWNFEIHRSEDGHVTLGKILLALIVTILGLRIAKKTSALLSHIARKNFHLEPGVADAGQRLLYYLFGILFVLYALHLVRFPLTAFTVVGGALALGLGFGSQAVMNNFISGLILLIERPVKRGDFVEIDNIIGTVETIGLRSTVICTPSNVHLVIPNSSFIENNVTNWTLSDRIIRMEIRVGVAYETPVDLLKKCLEDVLKETEGVINNPPPLVLFSDFGNDALQFDLLFWTRIDELVQRRKVQSSLRFGIEARLKKEGITIAFPQRDLHLDTVKPLEIKLMQD